MHVEQLVNFLFNKGDIHRRSRRHDAHRRGDGDGDIRSVDSKSRHNNHFSGGDARNGGDNGDCPMDSRGYCVLQNNVWTCFIQLR